MLTKKRSSGHGRWNTPLAAVHDDDDADNDDDDDDDDDSSNTPAFRASPSVEGIVTPAGVYKIGVRDLSRVNSPSKQLFRLAAPRRHGIVCETLPA